MTDTPAEGSPTAADPSRYFPWMLLLFAGSGASALIYEIVWYQQLQLAIGSTAVSLGVLLATYMGGLSLGSWLLPKYIARKRADDHPLRLYGFIEVGIAALGLLLLVLIPIIDKVYVAGAQSGAPGMVLRALFCAVALLPPTILMGASLPAMAKWAEATPKGASWWGLFYGINIAGAVVGSLLAGFFLLRLFDIYVATIVAAAINLLVAGVSFALAKKVPHTVSAEVETSAAPEPAVVDPAPLKSARAGVLTAIGLSGVVSLGAQVVWARIMGPMLGGTVYVFATILAVFLLGLGLGAALGSKMGRKVNAREALGWSQVGAALGLAWTAYQFSSALVWWPMDPKPWTPVMVTLQSDLVRTIWGILPATIAWGASVPLAFAAARSYNTDAGKTVGGIYAINTLGCIFGALLFSLVFIPRIGTHRAEQILVVLSLLAAFCAFAPTALAEKAAGAWKGWAGLAAAALASIVLIPTLRPVPVDLIAYGRRTSEWKGSFETLRAVEGMNTSIAYTRWSDGAVQFHVAGKVEASTEPYDMSLQRMLGYVPLLVKRDPQSVLIVGFGAGVTAGTFVNYNAIKRIVICEIEPVIPPNSTDFFRQQNHNVVNDPRTQIYYDDARHYVLTTKEKFDLITSDPIHPFVKGLASLYSKEYFEMLRKRLNKGGVVTQWIPLYESDFATVKSEIATFFEVFPYAEVFANTNNGAGYDLVLLGHEEPMTIDMQAAEAFLTRPDNGALYGSMAEVGFLNMQSLLDTYVGDKRSLSAWLKDAQINRDKDLRLQYLAGFALNRNESDAIYQEMVSYKVPPAGLRFATGFAAPQSQ